MQSMTGFGRFKTEQDGRKITLEIKSVNHRFLDINIRLPRILLFAEDSIRKIISNNIARGRIDVFVNYTETLGEEKKAVADLSFLASFIDSARKAAQQTGLKDDLSLSHIIAIPGIISVEEQMEDEKKILNVLSVAVCSAMEQLKAMRAHEGAQLKKSIKECTDALFNICGLIKQRSQGNAKEYAERLREKIAALMESETDETRFATEVAIMAERADITEELVRLNAHLTQINQTIECETAAGRKLDFLVQELNREANTIGSKACDIEITRLVVEAKSVIEKIREQVQNIE